MLLLPYLGRDDDLSLFLSQASRSYLQALVETRAESSVRRNSECTVLRPRQR